MLYSRSLLTIYFIHSSVYLLIPNSQFIPPLPLSLLITIFVFYVYEPICFLNMFICTMILDST